MPGKPYDRSFAGGSAGIVMVILLMVLLGIAGIAFVVEMALRAGIRASSVVKASEAMAQEKKPAGVPRLQDPQVWVGELYAVGSGEVRYLQAKGSFRMRSECDAWVRRAAESRKFSHYGIAARDVVQAGEQADESFDAINYRDKYNTWAAFCYRAR